MEQLKLIRINSKGSLVKKWQYFLLGNGFYSGLVDGDFGPKTLQATIEFQEKYGLEPDGIVGNKSYGLAMQLGFAGIIDIRNDKSGANWPTKPVFKPLISNAERQRLFGNFKYSSSPVPGNPENIKIRDNWQKDNIITVSLPQLRRILKSDKVEFHKLAAPQLQQLWADWENAGLLHLILSWGGSFVPRFVRGSRKTLSNHAFGSAFDINVAWNARGSVPALVGQKGSVRELVEIANTNGFYWGGHFSLQDGMHFEIAQINNS